MILYHDSFGKAMRSYIARGARILDCYWTNEWDIAALESSMPDVVVEILTERKLVTTDPQFFALQTKERLRDSFEASDRQIWQLERAAIEEYADSSPLPPGRPDSGLTRFARLPIVTGRGNPECIVAAEVESTEGGIIELELVDRVRGPVAERVVRAFAPPGRQTVYFQVQVARRPREVWLSAQEGSWTVHRAAARRVARP